MHTNDQQETLGGTPTRTPLAAALGHLNTSLDRLLSTDVSALEDTDYEHAVKAISTSEARLAAAKAKLVSAASRAGTIRRSGAGNPGTWLTSQTSDSFRSSKATEKLGDAIEAAPELGEALAAGHIGPEQAAVVSQVIERGVLNDADQARLLRDAREMTPEKLRRTARRREAAVDQDQLRAAEQRARDGRYLRIQTTSDGSVTGQFQLAAIEGQTLLAALQACTLPDPADTPDELARTPDQRRADGLSMLATLLVESESLPTVRTVKPHVSVIVPVAMLQPDLHAAEHAGAFATSTDGTILSAATARQLLCDASVRRIVIDPAGQPLDVGRATRTWSGPQRAALAAIDGGCRGPMCDRPFAWTDIHHIRWWRNNGETSLDNGAPLCRACHNLVHHNNWTMTLDPTTRVITWRSPTGQLTTTRPRGPAAPQPPPQPELETADRKDPTAQPPDTSGPPDQPTLAFEPPGTYDARHQPQNPTDLAAATSPAAEGNTPRHASEPPATYKLGPSTNPQTDLAAATSPAAEGNTPRHASEARGTYDLGPSQDDPTDPAAAAPPAAVGDRSSLERAGSDGPAPANQRPDRSPRRGRGRRRPLVSTRA